ncbi:creatininase family protein [Hyalangium sp.]|uniref:creatininase family protein n=1 Tax=Hyalangium sp. TaxID=2028555 RepID=UPI002D35A0EF|nr:creatininase family protein [Hyalangium sp.]HYI01977.1 creatininase family protein [Hyalangium sp.]
MTRLQRIPLVVLCGPLLVCSVLAAAQSGGRSAAPKGVLLEQLTWQQAEKLLTRGTVVVIPLGAQAKAHGPHLPLANDWNIAEYLKQRVHQSADVVIAPTINYSFYPAFLEYPGSTTLRMETARDMIVDICRSLARHGPRRFYVLNTGISTVRPLRPAAELLAAEGILLHYTDLLSALGEVEKEVSKQEGGTHADEIETSMMLYIAPKTVDMSKAVKDYHPGKGPLTRTPTDGGIYSPSGVFGDATLATRAKGKRVMEAYVSAVLADIETLRRAPLGMSTASDGGVPGGTP